MKQLAENIINSFLFELELFLTKPVKPLFVFSADYLLKILIILKSEYPLIYEIFNDISIEINDKSQLFLKSLNAPPLKDFATFNDYFVVLIVGFGFGVYNSYLIDTNIMKKFSLGFMRKIQKSNGINEKNAKNEQIIEGNIDKNVKNEEIIEKNEGIIKKSEGIIEKNSEIYHKEAFFLYETVNFLLENLKSYTTINIKDCFSSSICLFNQTNFLLNLLGRLKNYNNFSFFYEISLRKSVEILCLLIKNAKRDELMVLQALEIEAKIAVLYKEHMRYLYDKKAKELNISEKMKARNAKFFFQKHMAELIEEPELAVAIKNEKEKKKKEEEEEKEKEENEEVCHEKSDFLKKIQEYGNLF